MSVGSMNTAASPSCSLVCDATTGGGEGGVPRSTEEISLAEEHVYVVPQRCVRCPDDMGAWEKSISYHNLMVFINTISQSIQGKRCGGSATPPSERIVRLLGIFDKLDKLVDETPSIQQPQRFGNSAFRECYAKLKANCLQFLQDALPVPLHRAAVEMSVYLMESFGNATRIDYGTGHELSFIMFLCCLFKVEALIPEDSAATGLQLFNRYLKFVRKLQMTYRMEPAGSHGVWSLDDYQFVPFIWGSAQLAALAPIRPSQFLEPNIIEEYKEDYMFVGCIDYINKMKTGNFAEHSPQLWNISAVDSWLKINAGLVKMYQKELLAKYPVIQHVLFGSLMEFKPAPHGHIYVTPRLGMLPPPAPGPSTTSMPSV